MLSASCLLDSPQQVAALATSTHGPLVTGIYRVKLVSEPWERRAHAALRHQVFCVEQGLFDCRDQDEFDASAIPIVAVSYTAVLDAEVVGTVRIYEQSPGVWFGSRLAVRSDWRGVGGLAGALIRCAVNTAVSRQCNAFFANVQRANVRLFRRLHWRSLRQTTVCGEPHHLMEADLTRYAPTRWDASGAAAGSSRMTAWH